MKDITTYTSLRRLTAFRLCDFGGFDYLAYDNKRMVYITTEEEGLYQIRRCKVLFTYSNN